jgi:hypothetical protein
MRVLPLGALVWALGTIDSVQAQQAKQAETIGARGPLADSLRTYVKEMVGLLRERNVDAAIRLYGDTTRFVHVENGVMIPWAQLANMMRTYLRAAPANPLRLIGEPGVVLIDRNTAVVYAAHHFDDTPEAPAHDGVWTGVLRRGPNGWLVVHSHSSHRKQRAR